MSRSAKLPLFVKASILLMGMFVFIAMLYIGQELILPVIYATIIAILISPMVNFLVKKRVNRMIAVLMVSVLVLIVVAAIVYLVARQISHLQGTWPQLKEKFEVLLEQGILWVSSFSKMTPLEIRAWITDTQTEILDVSSNMIGNTITTVGGLIAAIFLTPVYIVMILFYQPHLREFIRQLFGASHEVGEVLSETKSIIQSYLVGLFFEFLIVAILNSVGLLIIGLPYAVLLGIIGAVLNVIPYLGAMTGATMFMVVALVTKPPIYVFYVFLLYYINQLIDNNFIVPKIVGSKVKLNALFSLFAVIVGATLWGIPGMFLSIPLVAILKLVLDRIEPLKPWGFLLGDSTPPLIRIKASTKAVNVPK